MGAEGPCAGCRTALTQRTRAASDAQMESVVGSGAAWDSVSWEVAMRADLLFENSAAVLDVAEPHGTQRPELVVLEGGMDAGMVDVMRRAGAHFENLDKSVKVELAGSLSRRDGQIIATFAC